MNQPSSAPGSPASSPAVITLLAANVLTYLAQLANPGPMDRWFALWTLNLDFPNASRFESWQLLTYGFLHGGNAHLMFNMLALWMFGMAMERAWGSMRFVTYYLLCIIGAGLMQLAANEIGGSGSRVVGASGGVLGLLLAFGLAFPNRRVMLLFPPIPMRAITLVVIYGVLTLFMGLTGTVSFVAHFAHLGGMVAGLILTRFWPQTFPTRWHPKR
ncbi:MAG: rhomboid family intramembrane serine protease [Gammaproteobacteria bacterium]